MIDPYLDGEIIWSPASCRRFVLHPRSSSQFGGRSAPVFGINVRDGLRETPMVPGEVLDVILSFPVRIVLRFPKDLSAVLPGTFAVRVDVRNSHHDSTLHRDAPVRSEEHTSELQSL